MRRRRTAWWVSLLVVALAGCRGAPRTVRDAAARAPVHETFTAAEDVRGLCVLVPVRLGATTHTFILDTGTTGVIFDKSLRADLGEPLVHFGRLETPSGAREIELFDPPDAFLGGVNLAEGGRAACDDLSLFRSAYGANVRGIVGMSVLRNYVVRIDFARATVEMMNADRERHPEWGMRVPLELSESWTPHVTMHLGDNTPVRMMIDTGDNTYGDLSTEVFKRVLDAGQAEVKDTTTLDLDGVRRGRTVSVSGLRLGHYTYRELPFAEAPGSQSQLGLAFMARHRVTFDFPNRKLYLVKIAEPVRPATPYVSGLLLVRTSGKLVVHHVIDGTPAAEAGMRPGDVVLRIGDTDASALEPWRAARLMMSDREEDVTLTIERDGTPMTVSFKLCKGL